MKSQLRDPYRLVVGRLRRTGGFTLVELLVVMAIIAILASLLFPVVAKTRLKTQSLQSE